ncbi:MAG: NAD(P)-dependent oxidoreductase [Bacteroidales bacterium]|nr:NAD(P)-dependent oxidoreductase [Bacteroidales bacterium]
MKIGLIKETKVPVDNRVALSPKQMAQLKQQYPEHEFVVQESELRAFSDEEYRQEGLPVVQDMSDCDILFGIKEAKIESLIPNKHYIFFGHVAKMQAYNRPLLQALMAKHITFTDYEYLVDDKGIRVCAFGWWAGVVGVYYTLRGYGLRHHLYELPKPDRRFTLDGLKLALRSVPLPAIKLLVTGNGRVSQGAQYILNEIGACRMDETTFLSTPAVSELTYAVADVDRLVKRKDGEPFSWEHFNHYAQDYESDFMRWAYCTDVLVCAHFWAPDAPVYLSEENLKDSKLRIRMIGDITCDIQGSVKSTLRPATHDDPYFDYNPHTAQEEPAFSSDDNISVMAVDTCPNALAMDTSAYFGDMLMEHVIPGLLTGQHSDVVRRGTLLEKGQLTPRFAYLTDFAQNS